MVAEQITFKIMNSIYEFFTVPSGPVAVTISDVTVDSVTTSWQPPTELNGIITRYTVFLWNRYKTNYVQQQDVSADTFSVNLESLMPNTPYFTSVVVRFYLNLSCKIEV